MRPSHQSASYKIYFIIFVDTTDYKCKCIVSAANIKIAMEYAVEEFPRFGCSEEFTKLATTLMTLDSMDFASTPEEGKFLFQHLIRRI